MKVARVDVHGTAHEQQVTVPNTVFVTSAPYITIETLRTLLADAHYATHEYDSVSAIFDPTSTVKIYRGSSVGGPLLDNQTVVRTTETDIAYRIQSEIPEFDSLGRVIQFPGRNITVAALTAAGGLARCGRASRRAAFHLVGAAGVLL